MARRQNDEEPLRELGVRWWSPDDDRAAGLKDGRHHHGAWDEALETIRHEMEDARQQLRERLAARQRGMTVATDLRGMLRYISEHRGQVEAREHVVLLLSDMQDVEPGRWSFGRTPPAPELLETWREMDMVPDLAGCTVYVFRCGPAHGIGNGHYRAVRAFWERYFEAAGAKLGAYTYHRDLELVRRRLE